MKIKLLLKSIFIFFIAAAAYSQNTELSYLSIPQKLKENANAVIRNYILDVNVSKVNLMSVNVKKTVTVLNKLGRSDASMSVRYDNDTKVTKLYAKVYDGFGNLIKKYSKRKFKDVSAVEGGTLYSDSRMMYLNYTPVTYPYTIVFESEYTTTSTGFIPRWFPTNGYYVSVQNNEYKFSSSKGLDVRFKEKNFKNYPIENLSSNGEIHYVLKNLPAIKYESYSLSMRDFMPTLLVSLNAFSLNGIKGYATNWKELGAWEYNKLYKEDDVLDLETKQKILNLTKDEDDIIKKAKIVYNYVQNKTRYINVSVGIGGFKPVASNKVDVVGYGDCKGLTNYTRALLKVIGIDSYFVELFAGNEKRNMDSDFSIIQGNHVILNIPNGDKDIWLECTNQTIPFGFLGDFTDDRTVLVITPNGGLVKRTPKYLNKDNYQIIKANIELKEDGSAIANLVRKSYGIQYGDKYLLADKSKSDLEKYYKSKVWDYNNNLEIKKVNFINNKEKIEFIENIELAIKDYARVKDSSILFRVNMLNKYTSIPKRYRKREKTLQISRGFYDKDQTLITIPNGYQITNLPQPKEIKTKFGYYKVVLEKVNTNSIKYLREIFLKEGTYLKEDYKKYRSFRKKIAKYDNLRLELTKQ